MCYNSAWAAYCYDVIGNILGHHAANSDHYIVTYGYTGIHYNIAAYPDIIADRYSNTVLIS